LSKIIGSSPTLSWNVFDQTGCSQLSQKVVQIHYSSLKIIIEKFLSGLTELSQGCVAIHCAAAEWGVLIKKDKNERTFVGKS